MFYTWDSTHIKASANKHRFNKELTYIEAKAYRKELENEINSIKYEKISCNETKSNLKYMKDSTVNDFTASQFN